LLFVIDAQLPPSLAEALQAAGFDAVHVVDLGLLDRGEDVIEFLGR
jgi:predicted nuclease of predicted toxin-antitoxin system